VRVSSVGPTPAEGVSLKARKGRKGLSKSKQLNLAAGARRAVKLKLSDKGLEKLADLDQVKIKVTGTVDFGFADKTSKRLK
jgi:hypothetical protein